MLPTFATPRAPTHLVLCANYHPEVDLGRMTGILVHGLGDRDKGDVVEGSSLVTCMLEAGMRVRAQTLESMPIALVQQQLDGYMSRHQLDNSTGANRVGQEAAGRQPKSRGSDRKQP